MKIPTEGHASRIRVAITQGNPHLDLLLADYFNALVKGLASYRLDARSYKDVDALLHSIDGQIVEIDALKEDFVSILSLTMRSMGFTSEIICDFFRRLLQFYEDQGIVLYTSREPNALANDPYRYFNQSIMISFAALALDFRRFDLLKDVVKDKYTLVSPHNRGVEGELFNFIRYREFNYTLNEYLNTGNPRRVNVFADYVMEKSKQIPSRLMVKADILLYYLSLIYPGSSYIDRYWFPELSCYNISAVILPDLKVASYFEQAKVLFGVKDVNEFKTLIDSLKDEVTRNGEYSIPPIKVGLLYDNVASV